MGYALVYPTIISLTWHSLSKEYLWLSWFGNSK